MTLFSNHFLFLLVVSDTDSKQVYDRPHRLYDAGHFNKDFRSYPLRLYYSEKIHTLKFKFTTHFTVICKLFFHLNLNLRFAIWRMVSRNFLRSLSWAPVDKGKEQESIQSSTTSYPGNQWENDNFAIGHHKREPRSPLSQQVTTRHQ